MAACRGGLPCSAENDQTLTWLARATCPEMGDALDVVIEGALAQTHTPEESIVCEKFLFAPHAHYYIKSGPLQQPPNG